MKAAESAASAWSFDVKLLTAFFQKNGFFGLKMDFHHCVCFALAPGTGDDGLHRHEPGSNVQQ